MASTFSFQNPNYGVQTGINSGTINAHFHTDPLDRLPIADGAEFGSYTDQHEEECLLGTRTDLIKEIAEWAVSPEGKCIFWLNGMAGTGKSTISRSMAKHFKHEKILGASFFFKRGEGDRGNARKLFPSITKQLAKNVCQLTIGVRKAIGTSSDIGTKGLREQFNNILLQPLLDLDLPAPSIANVVIVIDALDECDVDDDIRLILQLLPQLHKSKAIRIRVLLTSRPELPIRLGFEKLASHAYEDIALHEIPTDVVEHDLSLFLNHKISEIKKERYPPLPVDWPGDTYVQKLVTLSVPLFIFAATICRILDDPGWDPLDSLPMILAHEKEESKLGGTYLPVLNRLLTGRSERHKKELIQGFQQVVSVIVILEHPLSVVSLSRLLELPERLIIMRLRPMHSVLSVPNDNNVPVRLFHLSFRDFLLDPATCNKTPFWVEKSEIHYRLTLKCLHVCQSLQKNICQLPSDGIQRTEIDRQTIGRYLPPELQYACRYWAFHLAQCIDSHDVIYIALSFLERHFLHWVEAMCLLGLASEVVGIVDLLMHIESGSDTTTMFEFLQDARRFMLKNQQIANDAPLQLYCSGLIFAPQKAVVRRKFESELPGWISLLPRVEENWSTVLQTLEGHLDSVRSVAFSPDGRLLASGSDDCTVRLWGSATGALQMTLEGHSDSVNSVTFSPDGRLLASGCSDHTVRLWDSTRGALQMTLEGHLDSVNSVAFSPDSRLLASGSNDHTVRLWDTATGALQQILEGHLDSVRSVAFSPDSRLLVSGSNDHAVRLWDSTRGALQMTLEGHSDSVNSVAFSPNGQLLVSGSDRTVRLWDSATGAEQQTLEGHLSWINSVAFSPDGRLLASGSDDRTISLWDSTTGAEQQTLLGHLNWINSVAFSPDGRLLASGSDDRTIRLWDSTIGAVRQNREEHISMTLSVKFSSDGRLLVSYSDDHKVLLWDSATFAVQQTLKSHKYSVNSVAFSPNGRLLASGSDDGTIRLWDSRIGVVQQILKGHSKFNSVAFSPNGRLLASGSNDCTVRLWGSATGALQMTLKGHSDSVNSVTFSPDSRLLASGSDDHTVRLWDSTRGALQMTLEGHSDSVNSVAFSPDSRLLASGSNDHTVRLWDTATGALQRSLCVHLVVTVQRFSPDSSCLITDVGSFDIQSRCDSDISTPLETYSEILAQRGHWIVLRGKPVLWLPPEVRSTCSAISANVLALGHQSGRVSFLGFRV